MDDLATLLTSAGFRPHAGANASELNRLESLFDIRLPYDFRELYVLSDGADSDHLELLPLSKIEEYAEVFGGGFGYVPFTDSNDSNPYAICCRGPITGMIVHVFHDDESLLICRGLNRFLDLVADVRRRGADIGLIDGDFSFGRQERSAGDPNTARELMQFAEQLDRNDESRTDALRFAAQLFGAGQEDELAAVLELGNEYVREAVLRRWKGLGTPVAQERLSKDSAGYQAFLAELNDRLEAAGVATEPFHDGTFRIGPGRVCLNFKMLFAESRDPMRFGERVQLLIDRARQG